MHRIRYNSLCQPTPRVFVAQLHLLSDIKTSALLQESFNPRRSIGLNRAAIRQSSIALQIVALFICNLELTHNSICISLSLPE